MNDTGSNGLDIYRHPQHDSVFVVKTLEDFNRAARAAATQPKIVIWEREPETPILFSKPLDGIRSDAGAVLSAWRKAITVPDYAVLGIKADISGESVELKQAGEILFTKKLQQDIREMAQSYSAITDHQKMFIIAAANRNNLPPLLSEGRLIATWGNSKIHIETDKFSLDVRSGLWAYIPKEVEYEIIPADSRRQDIYGALTLEVQPYHP